MRVDIYCLLPTRYLDNMALLRYATSLEQPRWKLRVVLHMNPLLSINKYHCIDEIL